MFFFERRKFRFSTNISIFVNFLLFCDFKPICLAATSNLEEDFFLTHVLKNAADENIKYLRTTYFLQIMDKFKDNTPECAQIADICLGLVDPTDDRISLLWNKVKMEITCQTILKKLECSPIYKLLALKRSSSFAKIIYGAKFCTKFPTVLKTASVVFN